MNTFVTILFLAMVIDIAICSPIAEHRLIGGQDVKPNSIPFQVAITFANSNIFCGGALVSRNYVLTAAGCVDTFENNEAIIILGAHDLSNAEENQVKIISKEIKIHPDYDTNTASNNIALIKLSTSVDFTETINAAILPTDENEDLEYKQVRISGWGKTALENPEISTVLKELHTQVITEGYCQFYFPQMNEKSFCTLGLINGNHVGGCTGDGGNPVITSQNIVVGLLSYGTIEGCELGVPTVHTNVSKYLEWIHENSDL